MIDVHEIYMGQIILETIKNELGDSKIAWYRDEKVELASGNFREKVYYLTNRHLIETLTFATSLSIKKFNLITIKKVEKELKIKENNLILENVKIYFSDNSDHSG